MGLIREHYDALVKGGGISEDPAQVSVVARYDELLQNFHGERFFCKNGFFGGLFNRHKEKRAFVKGLYVYGEVGRGKTMLMDLFFSCLPDGSKRRVHFNDFMNDVHNRIRAHRQAPDQGKIRQDNPFPAVAAALAHEAHVLCFDEFAVTDIADAMILTRLFTALFKEGVVLIATSNVAPDNLYQNGLNRQLFLPFLDTLKNHVDVINLNALTDYRLKKAEHQPVYMTPPGKKTDGRMDAAWADVTGGAKEKSIEFIVRGHEVKVPRAAGFSARFEFADLCFKSLSAFDYMELAVRYRTFFIDHVPVLDDTLRNETRRFILLIDTLYDHHVRLFISAAARPDTLYKGHMKTTETFEYERTASRLFEMQSEDYLRRWMSGDPRKM